MKADLWGKATWTQAAVVVLFLFSAGCGLAKNSQQALTTDQIPTYQGPESDYCGQANARTYSSGTVTITGSAGYKKLVPFFTSGGGLGAEGGNPTHAIRYAEVHIVDGSGNIIQCTETDSSGNFSVVIPQSSSTFTAQIFSRTNVTNVARVYVYDDPRYNNSYSISISFTAGTSHSIGAALATTSGQVLAGAFNILDRIIDANDFLKSQVGGSLCSGQFTGCVDFPSISALVHAYWKKGFNPNTYYGGSSGLSFYLPGYSRLFILGGSDDDVDYADTDHFDDSVILHEYGHFLEDNYFASDSPGGSHNGNRIIDPRLAWSEGWGNFFQAAVRGSATYVDTAGNNTNGGSTQLLFSVNLETQGSGYDVPTATGVLGEGNFREFSVTRLLWDATDDTPAETANSSTDNIKDAFNQAWAALTNTSGWLKTSAAFRNIGLLHAYQSTLGTTSWSGIRGIERQIATSADFGTYSASAADYATYVSPSASSCTFTITPGSISNSGGVDDGSFSSSNLITNNDFHYLRITSTQTVTLSMVYTDLASGVEPDLDLYIYNESARFGNANDVVASATHSPDGSTATSENESITVTLSPGRYLINVNAYTYNRPPGVSSSYYLTLNGSRLCPANLP